MGLRERALSVFRRSWDGTVLVTLNTSKGPRKLARSHGSVDLSRFYSAESECCSVRREAALRSLRGLEQPVHVDDLRLGGSRPWFACPRVVPGDASCT